MGCVSSKGLTRESHKGSWFSRLSRNTSGASRNRRVGLGEEGDHSLALTSSSNGELDPETYQGSFLNLGRGKGFTLRAGFEFENLLTFTSPSDAQCKMARVDTKPWPACSEERKSLLLQENSEAGCEPVYCSSMAATRHGGEIINTWELMEGLEDGGRGPSSLRRQDLGILKHHGLVADDSLGDDAGSPVWKKYYIQEEDAGVSMDFSFARNTQTPSMGSPFSESPKRVHTPPLGSPFSGSPRWAHTPLTGSPFSESPRRAQTPPMGSPSPNSTTAHTPLSGSPFSQSARKALVRVSLIDAEDGRSVSSIELLDASTIGLKFFVSPAHSSFHPSPSILKEGSQFARLSFDGGSADFRPHFDDAKSPHRSLNTTRHSSKKPSMESVYGSGSPLFDPSLMATFEQALKATTEVSGHGEWLDFSTEESTTISPSVVDTQTLFDTLSDAESTPSWPSKENLSLKVMPTHEEHARSKKDMASYDFRCPPRGEGKVVLYVTSLRGIRKTFEDCCNLRLILRGLGVQVDERDVWMHATFRGELDGVLGGGVLKGVVQVPQLFIKGRHIGGAEEVKQLHEEGFLACLMDGLAMGLIHSVCAGCADARFVPCFSCNGSCKVIDMADEVSRCHDCNENGLIMCPMCNS